jgi:hypothetical protein
MSLLILPIPFLVFLLVFLLIFSFCLIIFHPKLLICAQINQSLNLSISSSSSSYLPCNFVCRDSTPSVFHISEFLTLSLSFPDNCRKEFYFCSLYIHHVRQYIDTSCTVCGECYIAQKPSIIFLVSSEVLESLFLFDGGPSYYSEVLKHIWPFAHVRARTHTHEHTLTNSYTFYIYQVQKASAVDVDKAVGAAKVAFENGEWSKMNARDRGLLMYR